MRVWKKLVIGGVIVLVCLAGFIAFVLPGIVKSRAIRAVEESTGRKLAIGAISLNPLNWTAEVRDVRYTERDGRTVFASFSSVRVAVSPSSVFRWAPIVSELRVSSPYLHLVRTGANTYNFSDLLEKKQPTAANKKEQRPAFSLNNISLVNGAIDFVDQALPAVKRHEVRGLELAVPFISTIPYYADRYIDPRFRAVVNGSPVALDGKLKPFARSVEYSLAINLRDLDLPYYAAYIPAKLPVRFERGTAATQLEVTYRNPADRNPELEVRGTVSVADLRLAEHSGAPLIDLTKLDVGISRASLLKREFLLSAITADRLHVTLARDRRGVWNVNRLSERQGGEVAVKAPPEKGKPVIEIGRFQLRDAGIALNDAMPPGGFRSEVKGVNLDLRGFSTRAGKSASYTVAFATGRGEKGEIAGQFALEPRSATAAATLTGIVLDAYYPYLAGVLAAPVKGRADLAADLSYSGDTGFSADKIKLTLADLAAPFGPRDRGRIARLVLDGGRYRQHDNFFELAAVTMSGADIRVSRDEAGRFSPLALLAAGKKTAGQGKAGPAGRSGPPFRYRIGSIGMTGTTVVFTDRKVDEAPTFTLKNLTVSARGITGPKMAAIPFRLSTNYGRNGTIRAAGTVLPTPLTAKGELALRRLPLPDFAPYLPAELNLVLAGGNVDTRITYALASKGGRLTGSFAGGGGVRGFQCLDAEGDDLLKWDSLQLDQIKGTLAPFALRIGAVALSSFYSRIIIEKDGRLNLQNLYTREPAAEGTTAPAANGTAAPAGAPAAVPPTASPAAKRGRLIVIDSVTMQDGTLNFTDRHLPQEYTTTLYNLGGRISGLSSEENRFADVDLRGNLENLSPLQITGKINPLRDDLYADLKVSFTDIELTPFTPYSGTYVGYGVERGKLSLDLKYLIQNKQLNSENKVFIDQLTFGKRIESDKATRLPVRLAVALLKDRKGEIHLDLPVTGRTDDPQFSVWRVVWKIIKNLLVKAATSPFTLLQAAFGGGEDFSAVRFAPGSVRLAEPEQAKLLKIAQAVNDRPSLKIDVTGFVDRERDPEGYRTELLMRKMRGEKFLQLVKERRNRPEDSAETMQLTPEEYSRYLKEVYRKEKFPKPRNILGFVKDIPDAEMKKLILANTVVGEAQLKALAAERAGAVKTFLVEKGKVDPARIFIKGGDIYKAPAEEGMVASRVEFGAAVD